MARIDVRRGQRGATLVSTMLMTTTLLTVSLLMAGQSRREVRQARARVARDQALMAAQATVELGAARYRQSVLRVYQDSSRDVSERLSEALTGYSPPTNSGRCSDIAEDCIPGGMGNPTVPITGQRNSSLGTGLSDCAGRPCMRPGAIVQLPDRNRQDAMWVEQSLGDLVDGGDPQAKVTLWIRNDTADALGQDDGSWTADTNHRVVFTAMARVRNTTVAIEQELVLGSAVFFDPATLGAPDSGYGGGHNNDNARAAFCAEAVQAIDPRGANP